MKKCQSYHEYFNLRVPQLREEFADFIAEVNGFLVRLTEDPRYHRSRTHGKSPTRSVTYESEDKTWIFNGKRHRGNVPYVDEATIYFRGRKAWRMVRESELMSTAHPYKDEIQHCLLEVAKNYDHDRPWCGPQRLTDRQNGLVYEAAYSGTDENFTIKESVYDEYGALLWEAVCKGGSNL